MKLTRSGRSMELDGQGDVTPGLVISRSVGITKLAEVKGRYITHTYSYER